MCAYADRSCKMEVQDLQDTGSSLEKEEPVLYFRMSKNRKEKLPPALDQCTKKARRRGGEAARSEAARQRGGEERGGEAARQVIKKCLANHTVNLGELGIDYNSLAASPGKRRGSIINLLLNRAYRQFL